MIESKLQKCCNDCERINACLGAEDARQEHVVIVCRNMRTCDNYIGEQGDGPVRSIIFVTPD